MFALFASLYVHICQFISRMYEFYSRYFALVERSLITYILLIHTRRKTKYYWYYISSQKTKIINRGTKNTKRVGVYKTHASVLWWGEHKLLPILKLICGLLPAWCLTYSARQWRYFVQLVYEIIILVIFYLRLTRKQQVNVVHGVV